MKLKQIKIWPCGGKALHKNSEWHLSGTQDISHPKATQLSLSPCLWKPPPPPSFPKIPGKIFKKYCNVDLGCLLSADPTIICKLGKVGPQEVGRV